MPDVKVPQNDGEIRLQTNGDAPVILAVSKGKVSVPDEHLSTLLENVQGAKLAPAQTVAPAPSSTPA